MPANWLPIHSKIKKKLRANDELMLSGGAGSGKSHFLLNVIFKRSLLVPGSRHLILRKRFEHMKNTIWKSAKEHIDLEWPGMFDGLSTNQSGGTWSITFPNKAEVIFGGADDKERIEKILGFEASTIYINEASEFQVENDIDLIGSRLRQNVGCRHLLLLDQNPGSKNHWSHKRYIEKKTKGRELFKINPIDVRQNLPPGYIERLESLPERLRQRFLHGEFTADVEGALWTWDHVLATREVLDGEEGRTVIGVDPATTNNKNSDETGIVIVAKKGTGAKVLADRSLKASPEGWARTVIDAFHEFSADKIVAEVNQGGDMVKTIINQIDQDVGRNIVEVRATKGKHVRAEPIVSLYDQGLIEHAPGLETLEDQLQSWIPAESDSPDRLDALVWALTEMMLGVKKTVGLSVF